MGRPERSKGLWLEIAAISAFILLGLINLPYPFTGDQALFRVGAEAMSEGNILYRDFWDIKQPGVYVFYLLGGLLFGFTEVGIHLFELLYMVLFYVTLRVTLRDYFTHPILRSFFPLLPLGTYYCLAKPSHLTQVEMLAGFPLYLTLYYAVRSLRDGKLHPPSLFLSGLMGGIVLFFKLMFLPIIALFWLIVLIAAIYWKIERPLVLVGKMAGMVATGLLLPVAGVVIYFQYWDLLDLLYKTYISYPLQIREIRPMDLGRVRRFVEFLLGSFATMMTVGVFGTISSRGKNDNLITIGLSSWFVIGVGVAYLLGSWPYHAYLILVPLGILCAKGLEFLWSKKDQFLAGHKYAKHAAFISLIVLFLPILIPLLFKTVVLARYRFALDSGNRFTYQSALHSDYEHITWNSAFLTEPSSHDGPIYVIGNPLYYHLSNRQQAIPINGWSPENWLPEQWELVNSDLSKTPPNYILIEFGYGNLIEERSPSTLDFITEQYSVLEDNWLGTWYELR